MHRYAFWIIVVICGICPAGCGPKLVEVTGTVTYNGKPLNDEGCKILFQGPEGQQAFAPIAPSGEYKVSGVAVGLNKVAIYYQDPAIDRKNEPGKRVQISNSPLMGLPTEYADVKTSDLTVEVDKGTVFNVDMKDEIKGSKKGRKPS